MPVDISKLLKKFIPHLIKAREENFNEAETVKLIGMVFKDILGYDAMTEITHECKIKEKFVDIAVKLDGVVRLLVEAKRAGVTLRDRHIDQAKHYAAEANIRWVLLSNGIVWTLYHLTFEEGVEYERIFSVDLSADPLDKASECLGLLHRKSLLKGEHEEFWERRVALSPESIAKSLFSENVLRFLRKEIHKREKILIDIEDIANELYQIFSPEARGRIGSVKIYKAKAKQKSKVSQPSSLARMDSPGSQRMQGTANDTKPGGK